MLKNAIVATILALVSITASAGIVEDIAASTDISDAKISPSGDYIAAMKTVEGKRTVVVFKFPSMELSTVLSFPGRNEVGTYWWVNEERIVATVNLSYDRLESEINRGELFAINADGTESEHLFGYRATATHDSGRAKGKKSELASAILVDPLWHDRKHILVEIIGWSRGYSNVVETAWLDVYNGRVSRRIRGPVANAQIIADAKGEVRFAYSVDDDQNTVIHIREDKRWKEFARIPYGESGMTPLLYTENGTLIVRNTVE